MKPKQILILCSRLDLPGGIERAVVNNANLFQRKGHGVTIFIFGNNANSFYPVHSAIKKINKDYHFGISPDGNVFSRKLGFLHDVWRLKNQIQHITPDLIISTEYPFTIAAQLAVGRTMPIYSWEHHHFRHLKKSKFWQWLFRWSYPKLPSVICLNPDEQKFYQRFGCKCTTIPNFIVPVNGIEQNRQKIILTISWLSKLKGVSLIPKIASKVTQTFPEWKFLIVGEGEEYESLLEEVKQRRLKDTIDIIKPKSPELGDVYNQAALYMLTSRFECFPMVLLEAMSHGVPCVAFDCPTGPAHIIKNGEDGTLVEPENIDAMADAIIDLIGNEEKRIAMGRAAQKNIQRFSPDAVYALWENLFNAE